MQTGNADIADAFDAVAHDFRGHGRFLGHRQVARAGTNDGDGSRQLGQRLFLDGHAPGQFMVHGPLEAPAQQARVLLPDASDQDVLLVLKELGGNLDDLRGRFTGAEDDLGEASAQRTVGVYGGEAKLHHGRRLEFAQHLVAAGAARSKLLQELNGFRCGHLGIVPRPGLAVTGKVGRPGLGGCF